MRKFLFYTLLLAPFVSFAQADTVNLPKDIFTNSAETGQWLRNNHVPALGIGVIRNGRLQQVKVFGELKKGVPAPDNTIFNVASLTKPVTAMVALKLVSAGQWNLDEPVYKYWTDPDIAADPRSKEITTRHLLTHRAGFPNWRFNNAAGKLAFEFSPGAKYQYSGEGFEYLRQALEKRFGKTLDQLAAELIFEPLKMKDTRFFWDAAMNESRFAVGYDTAGKAYPIPKNSSANAADDLLTTVEDYGRFLLSVMKSEGLTKAVFADMITNQVATTKGKHFGLGFEKYDLDGGAYALSHGGSDKGVKTLAFILPKSKQGLIIFTNVDDGYKVYETLVNQFLGTYGKQIIDIESKK